MGQKTCRSQGWQGSRTRTSSRHRQDGLQVWRCRGCLWLCARSLQLRQLCEEWSGDNQPEPVKGTDKTVCKCGGSEGSCPCPAGHCACASCGKSSEGATTEAKEAAQASGQQLPAGSV